jgi:hypothetical protein
VADAVTWNVLRWDDALRVADIAQRKTRSWRRKPREERVWVPTAFVLLGLSRAALLTVPFKRIAPHLGTDLRTAPAVPLVNERQTMRALHIGRAVRTAARNTPWESKCLAQAMTARVLLGAVGIPYVLLLGVARDQDNAMEAHAWVLAGRASVTGSNGFGRYTVVAAFVPRRLGTRA